MILVIFFMVVFIKEGLGIFWTLVLLLTPLVIIIALITVYLERMKELDEEEKDDLTKY